MDRAKRAARVGLSRGPRNGQIRHRRLLFLAGLLGIYQAKRRQVVKSIALRFTRQRAVKPMKNWPRSRWVHAGIACASALILSAIVAYLADRSALEYGIRTSPQYGEAGRDSL